MKEEEFLKKFKSEKESLREWGNIIKNEIIKSLNSLGKNENSFFKIPINIRVKDENSLVQKAFYRGKKYQNPLIDITDKVGIRIVVLLIDEIDIIKDIIENNPMWEYSLDRDYEQERDLNPTTFGYQSVHYVLRNKDDNNGIPKALPCEVQVRTLLQHAYSELTHDTIYKPKQTSEPIIHRLIARSMAMIETTDDIFKEVSNKMNKTNNIELLTELKKLSKKFLSDYNETKYSEGINKIIIDNYKDEIKSISYTELETFTKSNNNIINKIMKRKQNILIFQQPCLILIFYLIEKKPHLVKSTWPYTIDLIEPIYTQLGKTF